MRAPKTIARIRFLRIAKSFSKRTEKPTAIIMGDDGLYWVVPLAEMERLTKAGYELAE